MLAQKQVTAHDLAWIMVELEREYIENLDRKCGFWCNRREIMDRLDRLRIIVSASDYDDAKEGACERIGFILYDNRRRICILWIHQECRNMSYGTMIVRAHIRECIERGEMVSEVQAIDDSVAFWEGLKYVKITEAGGMIYRLSLLRYKFSKCVLRGDLPKKATDILKIVRGCTSPFFVGSIITDGKVRMGNVQCWERYIDVENGDWILRDMLYGDLLALRGHMAGQGIYTENFTYWNDENMIYI